jgi:Uri superfamily endonuclease
MTKGTYTLLTELPERTVIEVGALGNREFRAGWYAYTGSALGPGGFTRVERHRAVAARRNDVRQWHIDYLLGHPATTLTQAVTSAGVDAECDIAQVLPGDRVAGFGASDCGCDSHLVYDKNRNRLLRAARGAHRTASSDRIG